MAEVEPEEIERCGLEVGNAADELAAAARGLIDSGCELGARVVRAVAAVRDFGDGLESTARGWSATE
ncbi:hypothetical protein SAMN05421805_103150 [Saccharopolyspora antimicrobica]|uniref:Excreted virulence factor EspC, type VII ESX diderm n=1 Tax=Saccharopolyspora antimicrobica TaxID=455193 RepID=A0A1I4WZQ4_9PSEU|nr:hypothetical protein [Saccharopolyspora antimicrobica]RKT84224.1 hypothetical protein ATL45_2534 [Saccharopolyspora antimicrobica]SFN18875.1 hypothetical protein SAMN05421805_103150 [Saccharopolyspora antimicrobica]